MIRYFSQGALSYTKLSERSTKNLQTLNVLLVKVIEKDFPDVKMLITKDNSCLNYGP